MNSQPGIAVITGASAGIGKGYADRLARRGHDLLLVARRSDLLEELAASLHAQYGVKVETLAADLTQPEQLAKVAEAVSKPEITMLINNAGISGHTGATHVSVSTAETLINLNVMATTRLTLAALPGFRSRNHGTIVNVASMLAFHALPITTIYSATKGYILNFTRGLQEELKDTGVRVQLVLPGAVATDMALKPEIKEMELDPSLIMSLDHFVDAALAGLDAGELITMPAVEQADELLGAYDGARLTLLGGAFTGKPASRYGLDG